MLKATTGEARAAVISALVGLKDARVVPMLARILQDSDPFGDDNPLVLETLTALASMRDDRAMAPIAALARQDEWLAWGKTTQLRQRVPAGARRSIGTREGAGRRSTISRRPATSSCKRHGAPGGGESA